MPGRKLSRQKPKTRAPVFSDQRDHDSHAVSTAPFDRGLSLGMTEEEVTRALQLAEIPEKDFERAKALAMEKDEDGELTTEGILSAAQDIKRLPSFLNVLKTLTSNDIGLVQQKKRSSNRRNREEIDKLYTGIVRTIQEVQPPVTLRQLFYAMLPLGLYPKIEKSYKMLAYHTAKMRRDGLIPYHWFSDSTRWQRKPHTYSGLEEMLEIAAQTYRRALWTEQDERIEIWIEKDALASVFYQITAPYDVPLMVTRGFSSMSFIYEAAEAIKELGKRTHIYYFGDFDPSGVLISKDLERKLKGHGAPVRFERVAVNEPQIAVWDLPTRPTKRSGSHSKQFDSDRSVELDAVPPTTLRALIENCITNHLPAGELERLQVIEAAERESLHAMRKGLFGA